jgi:hypothetical protein
MPALSLRNPPLCVKLSPPRLATHHCTIFVRQPVTPVSPFFATLTRHLQPAENKATLSALSITLTSHVKPKSFVCRSYKKHRGVGESVPCFTRGPLRVTSATHRNTRNSNPFMRLLHDSLDTRGGVCRPQLRACHPPSGASALSSALENRLQPSTFNFQLSTFATSHQSRFTSHRTRVTPS